MSLLDYHPIFGPIRELNGTSGDIPDCTTQENVDWAKENAPRMDGTNYKYDYVPPFMTGIGCNACGYDGVGVGEDCSLCGIGHGINAG